MVELADTLVLGTSAQAWGFKSLYPYQNITEIGKVWLIRLLWEQKIEGSNPSPPTKTKSFVPLVK